MPKSPTVPSTRKKRPPETPSSGDVYEDLALAVRGRRANPRAIVEWVLDNALVPIAALDVTLIPSPGAMALLKAVKSEGGMGEFIRGLWAKTIPSRTALEKGDSYADDGSELVELCEELERAAKEAAT